MKVTKKALIISALFALLILSLLALFACRPAPEGPVNNQTNLAVNQTNQINQTSQAVNQTVNLSNQTSGLQQILAEFARLDAEFGTFWREEQIPNNLIPREAIEPWTAALLFIRKRLEQAFEQAQEQGQADKKGFEVLLNLVDARVKMLEAQSAYYAAEDFGEQGKVTLRKEGWKFYINETINCDDVPLIANATAYYDASAKALKRAQYLLDLALTASKEAQELIGVNEKRPAIYKSLQGDIEMRVKLTKQALAEQCAVDLVIKNE